MLPTANPSRGGSTTPHRSLIIREHPCAPPVPLALDPLTTGLHCLHAPLNGPLASYFELLSLFEHLRHVSARPAIERERNIFRIAYRSARVLGSVFDIPTVPGWAVFQKIAHVDTRLAALSGSIYVSARLPVALIPFDDVCPSKACLPEVVPYTQLTAVLYEALDSLLVASGHKEDLHLRNVYPHSVWTYGTLFSQGQVRRLAPIAPPPRIFSRYVECPVVGELLAVPGEVPRHGWITFFHALVPTCLSGGLNFSCPAPLARFMPRSFQRQKPAPASLLLEDLTMSELYYLVRIEEVATNGDVTAVYHESKEIPDVSYALYQEFYDRVLLCIALGVTVRREKDEDMPQFDRLRKRAFHNNKALGYAEQAMCEAHSIDEPEGICDNEDFALVYKRDARQPFAELDGYDGWSDEVLTEKKHKAWALYRPRVLMPSEVAALYSSIGVRLYCDSGRTVIIREDAEALDHKMDGIDDTVVSDDVVWTELKPLLERFHPDLKNGADRLLVALLASGQVRLYGYYWCLDPSQNRHIGRSTGVFMDAPLQVLAFKLKERQLSGRHDDRDCLLIPVGPACTILMRYVTEKFSLTHGRVHHSESVLVMPVGCRLGERRQLKWYAVGAGLFEPSDHPPVSLVDLTRHQLDMLSCSAAAESDHIVVCAKKGVASVRLRDIGFEAGWTGWSPHLVISGKGKRIITSVRTHSLTHLVDVLRRIRDGSKEVLTYSIQEVAALIVLKEVLMGALRVTKLENGLEWVPEWKIGEQGFVVAHEVALARGMGCCAGCDAEGEIGLLLTNDSMAVFRERGKRRDVWDLVFVRLDANIESEKLLVGPAFEGFRFRLCEGKMGAR